MAHAGPGSLVDWGKFLTSDPVRANTAWGLCHSAAGHALLRGAFAVIFSRFGVHPNAGVTS
jgi:hypothetical protein